MKPIVLVVQIALVGAGLLVYDTIRQEPARQTAADAGLDPIRIDSPAPADPSTPDAPPVVLEGSGVEALRARVIELERWKRDLERRLAERPSGRGDGEASLPAVGPGAGYDEPYGGAEGGEARPVREQDLAWFRQIKQEVDRLEREERYTDMIGRQLDRLGVALNEEQRDQLVKVTMGFRDKVRDTIQASAAAQEEISERQSRLETLRQEYEQTVFSLVPSAEAQKIVESMGRYPGFGFRRDQEGLRGPR